MTDLFEKSIRTLELPAVLEKLAAKAVSDAAKERCLRLTPATDTQEVLHLLNETDAAKERLGLHGSPSFSGVKDVSAALTRADHGGMLNTRELLDERPSLPVYKNKGHNLNAHGRRAARKKSYGDASTALTSERNTAETHPP